MHIMHMYIPSICKNIYIHTNPPRQNYFKGNYAQMRYKYAWWFLYIFVCGGAARRSMHVACLCMDQPKIDKLQLKSVRRPQ